MATEFSKDDGIGGEQKVVELGRHTAYKNRRIKIDWLLIFELDLIMQKKSPHMIDTARALFHTVPRKQFVSPSQHH